MNYVLFSSNNLPKYIDHCISNIKKIDSSSKIYLSSDEEIEYESAVTIVNSKVASSQTKEIIERNIYKGTNYESNPLWQASLIRIFIIRDIVGKYDLEEVVHFDNDVLIYMKAEELHESFVKDTVNITRLNDNELIFGYSYFNNFQTLDHLCNKIYRLLNEEISNKNWKNNPKNEMHLLGSIYKKNPEFFNILNSYPTKDSKYIFDSATYGQIIGGTHTRPRRLLPYKFYKKGVVDNRKRFLPRGGWLDKSHYVANEFLSDKSRLEFKKSGPYLRNKEGIYKIANLHIHSKELDKYKI